MTAFKNQGWHIGIGAIERPLMIFWGAEEIEREKIEGPSLHVK